MKIIIKFFTDMIIKYKLIKLQDIEYLLFTV